MGAAILNLLEMGGGGPVPSVPAAGQQATILETCSLVDVRYEELGKQTPWQQGFRGYGAAETKYRRVFSLSWFDVAAATLDWIQLHFDLNVEDGGVPFAWVRLNTTAELQVKYRGAPALNYATARQGGNSAEVILEEVFQTD